MDINLFGVILECTFCIILWDRLKQDNRLNKLYNEMKSPEKTMEEKWKADGKIRNSWLKRIVTRTFIYSNFLKIIMYVLMSIAKCVIP